MLNLTRLKTLLVASTITVFYWLYSRLWRVKHIHGRSPRPGRAPTLYAHWHGDELLLIGTCIGSQMAVMSSRSRDGALMGQILAWFGFRVVRGSSTRGGAGGLKGLIDVVKKEKRSASLAVDGPRGPIYRVKPGILKLAQETGRSIIPGAAAAQRRIVFKKAWNRCYLPLPFSKCVVVYGAPISVPPETTPEQFENIRQRLERRLAAVKAEAEEHFARKFEPAKLQVHATGV